MGNGCSQKYKVLVTKDNDTIIDIWKSDKHTVCTTIKFTGCWAIFVSAIAVVNLLEYVPTTVILWFFRRIRSAAPTSAASTSTRDASELYLHRKGSTVLYK